MVNKYDDKLDLIYDFLKGIDVKVDQIVIEQSKQGMNIAENTKDLSEHIRRTDLLETKLDNHEESNEKQFQKVLYPKQFIVSLSKMIGAMGGLCGAIYAIYRLTLLF